MSTRISVWLAWCCCALALALTSLGLLLLALSQATPVQLGFGVRGFPALFALSFSIVGVLIATRHPTNAIGWIFCYVGLSNGLQVFAEEYAIYALFAHPGTLPGGAYMAWIMNSVWYPPLAVIATYFLLLFPTGHLLSARWRLVAWLAAPPIVVRMLIYPFLPGNLENLPIANPLGVAELRGLPEQIAIVALVSLLPIIFASATSLVLRFRRAGGIQRQQIKWLAYTAVLLASAVTAGTFLNARYASVSYLVIIALVSVPIAVGIAMLRYRLFDIDLLINRTLVYSLLTATLGLLYISLVVLLQALLGTIANQGHSELVTVVSTLAIAALFNPLRRRIQNLIDKHFYRRKYDAARTLAAFSIQMRDATDLDTLTRDLLGVIDETLQPAHVSVWLREPGSGGTPDQIRPAYTTEPITLTVVDHQ